MVKSSRQKRVGKNGIEIDTLDQMELSGSDQMELTKWK